MATLDGYERSPRRLLSARGPQDCNQQGRAGARLCPGERLLANNRPGRCRGDRARWCVCPAGADPLVNGTRQVLAELLAYRRKAAARAAAAAVQSAPPFVAARIESRGNSRPRAIAHLLQPQADQARPGLIRRMLVTFSAMPRTTTRWRSLPAAA